MQSVSEKFIRILKTNYHTKNKVVINNKTYTEEHIVFLRVSGSVFSSSTVSIGGAVSSMLKMEFYPQGSIPSMAQVKVYVSVYNSTEQSEWIPKGVFYIDTRKTNAIKGTISIEAYDGMMLAERYFPSSGLSFPATDISVVNKILSYCGLTAESSTLSYIDKGYQLDTPYNYTCREILGHVAGMYGGNFIMSDAGALRLVKLKDLPAVTSYLSDEYGSNLLVGGVRILV